jgi:hypothetical protein
MNIDTDDEKVKSTVLEIKVLEQEYKSVLNQYQEAIKTYINNLSENDCSLYKKTDKNISQLCYDKIWHEQGCLTGTPQVDASKTLDELVQQSYNSSLAKNEDDIKQCYGNTSSVPTNNIILNGNFDNPKINTNSFKYISGTNEVPNWNFNGAALINNSSLWVYQIPYPKGSQAVSLQFTQSISQSVQLKKNVNYLLNFFCSGRNCCHGLNSIKVELYDNSQNMIMKIDEITPTVDWRKYTSNFTSIDTQTYKLTFSGMSGTLDKSSAIQGIELIEETKPIYPNMMDYVSLKGKTWWGTGSIEEKSAETQSECIAMCESNINCSGATFNPTKKMCWVRSGESEITPGLNDDPNYGSDYALIKKLKNDVIKIQLLNLKLISLNEQIINKMRSIKPQIENYENEKNNNNNYIEDYYNVLLRHQNDITEQLKNYENIESEYNNSSIYVTQQNWSYNIYAILAFIVIIVTFKKISEGDNMIPIFIVLGIIWAFYIFIIKFYKKINK